MAAARLRQAQPGQSARPGHRAAPAAERPGGRGRGPDPALAGYPRARESVQPERLTKAGRSPGGSGPMAVGGHFTPAALDHRGTPATTEQKVQASLVTESGRLTANLAAVPRPVTVSGHGPGHLDSGCPVTTGLVSPIHGIKHHSFK